MSIVQAGRVSRPVYAITQVHLHNALLDNNNIVEPPSDMFALGTMFQNGLPLISVETSEYAWYLCPMSISCH